MKFFSKEFLKLSLIFYSTALSLHFVTLVTILIVTIIYKVIKSKNNSNIYDNQSLNQKNWTYFKRKILVRLFVSGIGFFISKFLTIKKMLFD